MKYLCFLFISFSIISCVQNKAWHMGDDSNKNGIRDDIEKWIQGKYKDKPLVQKAMLKLASIDPASCEFKYHTGCLRQVSEDALIIQLELIEKLLDTKERRDSFESRVQNCATKDDRYLNLKCNFN